jgi:peptidoglycan-associated lipoprotein
MDIRCLHRCVWICVALTALLAVALPATAAEPQPAATVVASVGAVDATRQIQPREARAKLLLDEIVFRYDHIYFEFDSAKLLPGARVALARKVEWLRRNPSARLLIEGHCDARGTGAYNRALGQRRAEAVRAYLLGQGIAAQRVQILTRGETRPQVPAEGEAAWSWNRRTEFLPQ